ncbi:transposase [Desulfosporosinus sp. BICA1-9]|uniref:transposase n=1 Tax=Desulfosporosinus sp. BICA1-9 TaxID=1531958 RepID=UPI00345419A6
MNKEHLIHGRTCVYNVNYHLVWSVKYRRKVLTAVVQKSPRFTLNVRRKEVTWIETG